MAETTKKKTTTNKALDYLKLLQSEQSRLNKILKNAIDVDDANFTFRQQRKLKGKDALKLKKNEKNRNWLKIIAPDLFKDKNKDIDLNTQLDKISGEIEEVKKYLGTRELKEGDKFNFTGSEAIIGKFKADYGQNLFGKGGKQINPHYVRGHDLKIQAFNKARAEGIAENELRAHAEDHGISIEESAKILSTGGRETPIGGSTKDPNSTLEEKLVSEKNQSEAKKSKDPADLRTDVFTEIPEGRQFSRYGKAGESVGVLTRNQRKAFEKALRINKQKPKRAPGLYLTRTS
tara:strand:+ start:78 stop:947 length:870 start_codon:yes stop_codon:yes gene_type:complete